MNRISREFLDTYSDEGYIWYACYGSNINYKRFLYYINGDKERKYSMASGCNDKSKPLKSAAFIFDCPIYFAGYSKRWDGGMAFLDYENEGRSLGKLYKIKMGQFKDVLKQEQSCKLYDAIVFVDKYDGLPVFTFTASHRLEDITLPSMQYCNVIKNGLLKLFKNLNDEIIKRYFKEGNISEI